MMITVAVLALCALSLVAGRAVREDFGHYSSSGSLTTEHSSSTQSTTSSSSSDSTSSENRARRADRDQRRIELAVQDALLASNNAPAFPQKPTFKSKSYQMSFTTVNDRIEDEDLSINIANPVFGPVAVISYTSPVDGLWGPSRTRTQVVGLDGATNFGLLFNEVRRAGFLGEFDLRTLVQSDLTFDLRSPPLITPCFPVTDEPALNIELIVLMQNGVGQLRRKWLAIDRFFDESNNFVPEFIEELPMSVYNALKTRFEDTDDDVAIMTVGPCDQYSYFQ